MFAVGGGVLAVGGGATRPGGMGGDVDGVGAVGPVSEGGSEASAISTGGGFRDDGGATLSTLFVSPDTGGGLPEAEAGWLLASGTAAAKVTKIWR